MASNTGADALPSGGRIFVSIPDIFYIPEFVFGGLVWMLVASNRVIPENPLGWVMFVSVFCFVLTTLWFFIFLFGGNRSSIWPSLDVGFHFVAAVFYLSALVILAFLTVSKGNFVSAIDTTTPNPAFAESLKNYRLDIAAVVMCSFATLLYFLHAIFSAIRWKSA